MCEFLIGYGARKTARGGEKGKTRAYRLQEVDKERKKREIRRKYRNKLAGKCIRIDRLSKSETEKDKSIKIRGLLP